MVIDQRRACLTTNSNQPKYEFCREMVIKTSERHNKKVHLGKCAADMIMARMVSHYELNMLVMVRLVPNKVNTQTQSCGKGKLW